MSIYGIEADRGTREVRAIEKFSTLTEALMWYARLAPIARLSVLRTIHPLPTGVRIEYGDGTLYARLRDKVVTRFVEQGVWEPSELQVKAAMIREVCVSITEYKNKRGNKKGQKGQR